MQDVPLVFEAPIPNFPITFEAHRTFLVQHLEQDFDPARECEDPLAAHLLALGYHDFFLDFDMLYLDQSGETLPVPAWAEAYLHRMYARYADDVFGITGKQALACLDLVDEIMEEEA